MRDLVRISFQGEFGDGNLPESAEKMIRDVLYLQFGFFRFLSWMDSNV
jgi:hypothetical protein